jgi:hypothetical protein
VWSITIAAVGYSLAYSYTLGGSDEPVDSPWRCRHHRRGCASSKTFDPPVMNTLCSGISYIDPVSRMPQVIATGVLHGPAA